MHNMEFSGYQGVVKPYFYHHLSTYTSVVGDLFIFTLV